MTVESTGADTLQRLERRLQRERGARLEAEQIAERKVRELYDQQRRAQLLEAAARAANVSASVEEALQETLAQLCEYTGWPVGHAYMIAQEDEALVLRSTHLWRIEPGLDCAAFVEASEKSVFPSGIGLPGRVLAQRTAVWSTDVTEDSNFPRLGAAAACGLHAAFAFPVLVSSEVAAVIEFFCGEIYEPDATLLQTVEQIGAQLGRIIERSRAEEKLNAGNAALKQLFAEAESQRRAAEAANHAKSAFLAVTSHEIRTPLNAVLGFAHALRREPLTPAQTDLAQGVLDGGAMLLRLLNAVLDLSKIEAGKMTLDIAPFDLRAAARSLVKVWGPRSDELGVCLNLDLSGLPDPCVLASDAGKIEQTLANLLSNAMKFTPAGGEVTIRLTGQTNDGAMGLRVEIIDDGPGLAEADRARVFQPFEQTASGREAGGTGLGLSICQGNVSLLGGAIGVDHTSKDKSRFWFSFAAPLAQAPGAPATQADDLASPDQDRPLRILAAEDNPTNRKVLSLILAQFDVNLTLTEDGAEALKAVQSQGFDLVLMDANMPVMDGVAAVRAIRALGGAYARLPIHMLTANVFEDDVARYLAAGADGVLRKPIDVSALLAVLSEVAEAESETPETRLAV